MDHSHWREEEAPRLLCQTGKIYAEEWEWEEEWGGRGEKWEREGEREGERDGKIGGMGERVKWGGKGSKVEETSARE